MKGPLLLAVALFVTLDLCAQAPATNAASATPVPGVPADASGDSVQRAMTRRWIQIRNRDPELASRDILDFVMKAAVLKWPADDITQSLNLLAQMQDHDPKSKTCGNFAWDLSIDHPVDLNAAEFTMKYATRLWICYRDTLRPQDLAKLREIMEAAMPAIESHRVDVGYTNIFLMKIWNCIAMGEAFGNPQLAETGYRMFDQWITFTHENGITEYSSTTYNGIDFDSLTLIAKYAARPAGRAQAEAAMRYIYMQCRADWFAPGDRLGGAHSRDYDYLRGHGYTENYAQLWGWMTHTKINPPAPHSGIDFTPWTPPADSDNRADAVPRFVWQRAGAHPEDFASQYVGKTLAIGVSGRSFGPEDKTFTINFDGGPQMTMVNYFMDGRGSTYGQDMQRLMDGHVKAHHLVPFWTAAQVGSAVLFLSVFRDNKSNAWDGAPTCLNSQLDIPAEATVWQNGAEITVAADQGTPLDPAKPFFLRYNKSVVSLRALAATDDTGQPIAPIYYRDGDAFHAARISWAHAATAPKGEAHLVLFAKADENLDDAAFLEFQNEFSSFETSCQLTDGVLTAVAKMPGHGKDPLIIGANLTTGQRTTAATTHEGILEVNHVDLGRPLLAEALKNHSTTPSSP